MELLHNLLIGSAVNLFAVGCPCTVGAQNKAIKTKIYKKSPKKRDKKKSLQQQILEQKVAFLAEKM